jgi:hypothetical protein
LTRALTAGQTGQAATHADETHQETAARLCDTHYFCPDGGHYELAPNGKAVVCTLHGSAHSPRQQAGPSEGSEVGRLMHQIRDMHVALSFLEDGLHAVVTIDRIPEQ